MRKLTLEHRLELKTSENPGEVALFWWLVYPLQQKKVSKSIGNASFETYHLLEWMKALGMKMSGQGEARLSEHYGEQQQQQQ